MKLVVLTDDAERFRGALTLAAAHAALGGAVALFLQLDAVSLLGAVEAPNDAAHQAAGLPVLSQLLDEALALGVTLVACQSGMALAGIETGANDPRIQAGGPVQFLQECRDEERLLIV